MTKRLTVKSILQQALADVEILIKRADSSEQLDELVKLKEKIIDAINEIDEDHKNPKDDNDDVLSKRTLDRVIEILKLVLKVIGLHDLF